MLTRMVSISRPRDPPASASQSAGITGLSHRARPISLLLIFVLVLQSENILNIISILPNLLMFVLWSSIWSVLENAPCALEDNIYPAVMGELFCRFLQMSVGYSWLVALFWCSIAF